MVFSFTNIMKTKKHRHLYKQKLFKFYKAYENEIEIEEAENRES